MGDVQFINVNTVNNNTQGIADYLAQLLKDKKQLGAFPTVFIHLERLLDEEIGKVRSSLFQINGMKKEPLDLPEPDGAVMTRSEKVYVPVKDHPDVQNDQIENETVHMNFKQSLKTVKVYVRIIPPFPSTVKKSSQVFLAVDRKAEIPDADYNFVGRILGPRGMTAKQLEQETGCKIMVRGKGSMRDKKKEEQNRGKQNWEHLSDELHVLITVDDTPNRAAVKLQRAIEEVQKLLVPVTEGEDELKKRQLMELAIINGTYRDSNAKIAGMYAAETQRIISPATMAFSTTQFRGPGGQPLGAPLILSPRLPMNASTAAALLNGGGPPPLISPADGLLYTPYDYQYALTSPLLTEYQSAEHAAATGAVIKQRRHMGVREHPYQRAGSLS